VEFHDNVNYHLQSLETVQLSIDYPAIRREFLETSALPDTMDTSATWTSFAALMTEEQFVRWCICRLSALQQGLETRLNFLSDAYMRGSSELDEVMYDLLCIYVDILV